MSTEVISLKAMPRDRVGTRYARRVRQAGGLPAVVYGHKEEPVSITLDGHHAAIQLHAGHRLFSLDYDDGKSETVLLKDVQFDHLGRDLLHVDLERVSLDERVNVSIPVKLKGDPVGLKTVGAYLIHPIGEIDVVATVGNIEDAIIADISHLDVGDALHAGELDLPHQYELITDPNMLVASIQVMAEEPEETGEEAEIVPEGAEPERIGEKAETEEGEAEAEEKEG